MTCNQNVNNSGQLLDHDFLLTGRLPFPWPSFITAGYNNRLSSIFHVLCTISGFFCKG